MYLLDAHDRPSGRETVTLRPAWRVQFPDGTVHWAFIELRAEGVWITGYPIYPVQNVQPAGQPAAGAVVGAGAGALVGAALGGPPGALIGGIIGAVLVAIGTTPERR